MTNPWTRYSVAELLALANRADYAASVHHKGGRPYMAELCEKRVAELREEIASRQNA